MGSSGRKYHGHAGLGAELRRLRGGRTLQQIFELSRTPPLADRIKSVAVPTLSLIENGVSMPSLETLYSLSVIYKVPMQRLYEIVGLDRMVAATEMPSCEDLRSAFRQALAEQRWMAALAFALAGEKVSGGSAEELTWRESRATCLPYVGLATEAVVLLNEVLEDPSLPTRHRFRVLRNLSSAHLAAGHFSSAALFAREALATAPADLPAAGRLVLYEGLISALVSQRDHEEVPDPRAAREILRWVVSAREHLPVEADSPRALRLQLFEAVARRYEGNHLVAAKALRKAADDAHALKDKWTEFAAHWHLGAMNSTRGHLSEAWQALQRAEALASELEDPALVFDAAVEMLIVASKRRDGSAERYGRRCERHYPLVAARTPAMFKYERLLKGEAQ